MARLPGDLGDDGDVQGYRDDGVVLRTHKLGEADRIITLLTRQNGRVRAVAKGVRRTKSRFGGRLEPFTHVDVLIHPGRSLDVIQQAEVIRAYGKPLATDYPRYTAGTAMLETAEKFTPVEKEPAIRQFLLLIGGLRALGAADAPDYLDESDDLDEDEFDEAVEPDAPARTPIAASPTAASPTARRPASRGSCSTPTCSARSPSRATRPRSGSARAAASPPPPAPARWSRSRSRPAGWCAPTAASPARPRPRRRRWR